MLTKATIISKTTIFFYALMKGFNWHILCFWSLSTSSCTAATMYHYMVFINPIFLAAHGRYVVTPAYSCLVMILLKTLRYITIFMDVSLNPGPDITGSRISLDRFITPQVVSRYLHTNSPRLTIKYSINFLLSLRPSAFIPFPQVLDELKMHGVLNIEEEKVERKRKDSFKCLFHNNSTQLC